GLALYEPELTRCKHWTKVSTNFPGEARSKVRVARSWRIFLKSVASSLASTSPTRPAIAAAIRSSATDHVLHRFDACNSELVGLAGRLAFSSLRQLKRQRWLLISEPFDCHGDVDQAVAQVLQFPVR